MQSDLIQGLIILGVGMTTVFAILSIIVLAGRALIYFLNRFHSNYDSTKSTSSVDNDEEIAIIAAVVHQVTKGRGQVVNISKPITHQNNG